MQSNFFYFSQLQALEVPDEKFDVRFISTDNITVAFNALQPGAQVPLHEHMHETIDFLQEGELEMTIGNQTTRMFAGMVARVPSGIPHHARAITACRVINIFYPARDDFKAKESTMT